MDLNSLRTQVFEKTGIKIDTNDPIFALVALNEAVLSECVEKHLGGLESAAEQLQAHTAQLIDAGDRAKKLLLQMGQQVNEEPNTGRQQAASSSPSPVAGKLLGLSWRQLGAAGAISLLSALLTLIGQAALGYGHKPAPAVQAIAPAPAQALTPEQTLLIQNGEKYAKIWPKLDPQMQEKLRQLSQ